MGCDIHCYVEKKVGDKWEKITGFVSDWYDPESEYFSSDEYKCSDCPIDSRNYILFSYLAGVRSSGKSVVCLSEPKGIPEDVSEYVAQQSDEWSGDGHSHSWLTVAELYSGLDREVKYEGVVTLSEYKNFKEKGSPDGWCASVGGARVSMCTNAEMDNYLRWGGEDIYTVVTWNKTARESLSHFVEHSLPQLKERCDSEDLNDVRIVFWFDN